jgi:hypothetical protein
MARLIQRTPTEKILASQLAAHIVEIYRQALPIECEIKKSHLINIDRCVARPSGRSRVG